MNKKLFLGALLVGAIALNSCVDDKESASVTNVREAKAEQLKAVGEAAKTQAEAAKIAAEAEAKVKEAQAKLIAAQEAAQVAQTQIDKDKAAAEIQRLQEQLASEIAVANANIEKIKAEAEKYNMEAQTTFLTNQNTQIDNLTTLLSDYSTATTDLVENQRDLVVAQNKLAAFEAGLISWEDARLTLIADKQAEISKAKNAIAENDVKIATLEQYYGNIAAAQEQLTKAQAETNQLRMTERAANADYKKADSEVKSAAEKIANSRYLQVVNDSVFYQLQYWNLDVYASERSYKAKVTGSVMPGTYNVCLYENYIDDGKYVTVSAGLPYYRLSVNNVSRYPYSYLVSTKLCSFKRIEYTNEDGQQLNSVSYKEYPDTLGVITEYCFGKVVNDLKQYVKDVQGVNAQAAQDEYDAFDALVKAKAALDAATAEGSTATPDQVADARDDFEDARNEYYQTSDDDDMYDEYSSKEVLDSKKQELTDALANAQAALKRANDAVDYFASLLKVKSLASELATYQAYIASLNTKEKASAEALVAYDKADDACTANATEIQTLNSIVRAADGEDVTVWVYNEETGEFDEKTLQSLSEVMKTLKNNKTVLEGKLADLQEELAALDNDDAEKDYEEALEDQRQALTEAVEDAQRYVDAAQRKVDALKAAIDQLSAETPAE